MIDLARYYAAEVRVSASELFQYRMANLLWLASMVAEPVVYLVVWRTVAEGQGGSVGGYTANAFTSYFIVWTLVRQMNIALTPWAFEARVQQGEWSPLLLKPIHPFHRDLASFGGFKIVTFVLWIPVGIVLALLFRPELSPTLAQTLLFLLSLVTAYVMRFVIVWAIGLITFWIVRVRALFELIFALELVLSGRLVPLDLLPEWARRVALFLPFQWSFGFPIELLLGRLSTSQIVLGFAAQYVWFVVGVAAVTVLWRSGIKRYSAVGA